MILRRSKNLGGDGAIVVLVVDGEGLLQDLQVLAGQRVQDPLTVGVTEEACHAGKGPKGTVRRRNSPGLQIRQPHITAN